MNDCLRNNFLERIRSAVVLIDGALAGAVNMARDEALAQHLLSNPNDDRIYVRYYCWQPWCISLGRNQPISDIDRNVVWERGFDIVYRPTGGRAILHARELTYSLVLRLAGGLTHRLVYQLWHEVMGAALHGLFDIKDIVFTRAQADFSLQQRQGPARWLCFASSARHELMWRGRKLVGSAQRLYGTVLLQHGSLLLGDGHEQLAYCLLSCPDAVQVDQYLRQHSVTLEEICRRPVTFEEVAEGLSSVVPRLFVGSNYNSELTGSKTDSMPLILPV